MEPESSAPLPLTLPQACQQALMLRRKYRLSYPTIAKILGEYHGQWHGEGFWRYECYVLGAPKSPKKVQARMEVLGRVEFLHKALDSIERAENEAA